MTLKRLPSFPSIGEADHSSDEGSVIGRTGQDHSVSGGPQDYGSNNYAEGIQALPTQSAIQHMGVYGPLRT